MTDLRAEQNAMLERLCRKHDLMTRGTDYPKDSAMAALRELLLAVQERDAAMCEHFLGDLTTEEWPPCGLIQAKGRWDSGVSEKTATNISRAIRAQTYADLFLKEE